MKCVHRASNVLAADIVVAWLEEQGIAAFVKDRHMAGGYPTIAVAPRGVEVCALDDEQADRALELLRNHQKSLSARHAAVHDKTISVQCTECGRLVEFPGEFDGTVQICPSCGRTVDVGEEPELC